MLFSRQHTIKLYHNGQTEPFVVFTIECGHIATLDSHTIRVDGSILKFGNDAFVSVSEQ